MKLLFNEVDPDVISVAEKEAVTSPAHALRCRSSPAATAV